MHFTGRSAEQGGTTLLFLMAILLGFLAVAVSLSDDVNRRLRLARTDDQAAYVKELADRLNTAYDNLLRSRGAASYASQAMIVLDNPGTISGSQLLTALGETNPRYNVQAWVSDLKTFSPCTDASSCTGVSGQLASRKIYFWIPPESVTDTSGPNATGQWVADPAVTIWEVVDGQMLQGVIYGDTMHTFDRLVQWFQQYYAARLVEGGGTALNLFRSADCSDALAQQGLPCIDSASSALTTVLQATGLSASDLVDAWGFPIQLSNPTSATTLNLVSTQTQSNGQIFTVNRQIDSPN
jgi:hypothetical protein